VVEGGGGENAYAASVLGKNQILTGRARRQTMPIACVCYGGCVIRVLVLVDWHEEPESGGLQIGCFLGNFPYFGFSSCVKLGIILRVYVDCTKCL
jgi:hypothetical protein